MDRLGIRSRREPQRSSWIPRQRRTLLLRVAKRARGGNKRAGRKSKEEKNDPKPRAAHVPPAGAKSGSTSRSYFLTNPPPTFRRGTDPRSPREPPRRPASHASRMALLDCDTRGGRLLPSTSRTRMVLEPCLTSLGVLVLRPSKLRFVAGAFLDLNNDDGGFSNGLGGSARRIDLGRNVGRRLSGDNAALAFGSS